MKTTKCTLCGEDFPSRNRLFTHLKDSGHGVALDKGDKVADNNGGNNHEAGTADADGKNSDNKPPQLAKGNDAYYEYYLQQKICNNDDDDAKNEQAWKDAYHKLRTPLPVSYRIHESSPISEFSAQLLTLLEKTTTEEEQGGDDDHGGDTVKMNAAAGESLSDEKKNAAVDKQQNKNTFHQWSFHDDTKNNDSFVPKLRMTVTPNLHHRSRGNKSSRSRSSSNKDSAKQDNGDCDVYSPILHALQELGAIHRQELVSAIPPLVLWTTDSRDGKGDNYITKNNNNNGAAGSIIADLCAAPGSKSLQLLDMLYTASATANNNGTNTTIVVPSGLLVVNDSDRNRIVTLCQRSRHVPRAPMMSLNMDARYFPGMRRRCNYSGSGKIIGEEGAVAANNNPKEKAGYKQKYDKVLCDVPCSGDGTTRKNKQVWNTWSIAHSMSLHRLQRKILRRAMELLRPGGIVVYSTCSLNPLEDEAVVASVIEDVGGVSSMEVVPLPEWLVQKCGVLRGLQTWQVPSPKYCKDKCLYQSFENTPIEHQGGEGKGTKGKKGGQINRSMFPPPGVDSDLSRQLGHCGRFLPNDQLDSGGFFVACIRRLKVGELGVKDQASHQSVPNASDEMIGEETTSASALANHGEDELNEPGGPKPAASVPPTAEEQCTREGDWICASCKKVNFGRRTGSRCFQCKARKPTSLQKGKEEDKVQLPLLVQPQESVLKSFFDFFGISTGPESPFPLQNTRFIYRVKEVVIVVVSDALSKLAISDSWSPVREMGITLATLPNEKHTGQVPQDQDFRLVEEGLPILTLCATRRHFRLQPILFRNALAQSVRFLLGSSSAAEVERVRGTLDRSSVVVDSLCGNSMWYDSLQDSMWAQCKASPGFFIVSCECKVPDSGDSTGLFSFCGYIDGHGTVAVKTSLRVAAAMLVILHKYSEVVLGANENSLPETKRRRI